MEVYIVSTETDDAGWILSNNIGVYSSKEDALNKIKRLAEKNGEDLASNAVNYGNRCSYAVYNGYVDAYVIQAFTMNE